jgi:ketosteroid isomerase-like protein
VSANLDLVRSIYADWERGDFSSTEWAHPDIEWVIVDGPEPGTWTGMAGMAQSGRAILNAWQDVRAEVDESLELDAKRVLVLLRMIARGKTSGLELGHMQSKGAILFQLGDGKVTRLIYYWDRDRALADLGLAPESGSPDS